MNTTLTCLVQGVPQTCRVLSKNTSSCGLDMKLAGFLLLLSGWAVVIAAIALLGNGTRAAFILAGTAVEALGIGLVFHSHLVYRGQ